MTFLTALGFIALIGIPILIIIYIIKPKFQERKISSTYIWKLSLKYRKRRIPFQWLKNFLLILQCIIVAVLAFILASPNLKHSSNTYKHEKVVILDASASMMTKNEEGVSRFDRAKEYIESEFMGSVSAEHPITVIVAGQTVDKIVDQEPNADWAMHMIEQVEPVGTEANYFSAITAAINAASRADGKSAQIYMVSDQDFFDTDADGNIISSAETNMSGYIHVHNVSEGEWNFAVEDAYEGVENDEENKDYGETILYANILSYNKTITVTPCVDITYKKSTTSENTAANYVTQTVEMPSREILAYDPTLDQIPELEVHDENLARGQVKFDYRSIRAVINKRLSSYKSLKFYCKDENGNIIGEDVEDAFGDDDVFNVYGGENTNYKVLLAGEDTSFIYEVILAAGDGYYDVDKCDLANINNPEHQSGYDLYVYDNCYPRTFPVDGACWFLDPVQGVDYSKYGFTAGGAVASRENAHINPSAAENPILKSVKEIQGLNGTGVFAFTEYKRATLTGNNNTVLLQTNSGDPLVFSAQNTLSLAPSAEGLAQTARIKSVVFSFDINKTDFPLIFTNFPQLVKNMLAYSTSRTLENYLYDVGDSVIINTMPNAQKVVVSVGSDDTLEKDEYDSTTSRILHPADRGGVYTITQTLSDGTEKVEQFFVRCDPDESNFCAIGPQLVTGEFKAMDGETVVNTNYEDITKYFAAAVLVLLMIEWGLQYREQY